MQARPLSGLRLVEIDGIGPVPLAAMILADMGCEVVRITRLSGQADFFSETGGAVVHRHRPHIPLDIKSAEGRDQVLRLVEQADALIEGFRPGVMERLGLGPDVALARNPRLVYARMTGWGQTGPLAPRAGHDINYLAITGALHAMGEADRPPPPPLNLVADYGGGAMFAVTGILAGLLSAKTTGRGQVVDVAMTEGAATLTSMFHGLIAREMWRTDRRQVNLLDGGCPFYRCYACADGKFVAVGALEPKFFAALIAGLDLAPDRFVQFDTSGWPAMAEALTTAFASRSRDAWTERFMDTDACVSPVLSFEEAPRHPHNLARSSFIAPEGVVQPAPAPRFSANETLESSATLGRVDIKDMIARWSVRS